MLRKFIETGGVAVLFGPHIPYGDYFVREKLCGGEEKTASKHSRIEIKTALHKRVKEGSAISLNPIRCLSWTPTSGKTIAAYEDGSTAVLLNEFGKGKILVVPMSIKDAVQIMPDLVRDIFDYALAQNGTKRIFDIIGAHEDVDIAMSSVGGEYRLAAVNHRKEAIDIKILPLLLKKNKSYKLSDLKAEKVLSEKSGKEFSEIKIKKERGSR